MCIQKETLALYGSTLMADPQEKTSKRILNMNAIKFRLLKMEL
jgi:hypothetical protein